jgi:hypothetical protein
MNTIKPIRRRTVKHLTATPVAKKSDNIINIAANDKEAAELNRISKFIDSIPNYDPLADDRPAIGITKRSMQIDKNITKSSLKGKCPDEEDKKNIDELIKTYNLAFPYPHEQSLQVCIEEGVKANIRDPKKLKKNADKNKPSLAIHLPIPFTIALKRAYPLILSDKVQFDWFLKNYPEFNLTV